MITQCSNESASDPGAARKYRIGMVVLPNFNVMTTMAFIDPLRAANYVSGRHLYDWAFLSIEGHEVVASNGVTLSNTVPFHAETRACDLVMVSASWQPEACRSRPFFQWLRDCRSRGAVLGALDTGSFVLGFADLLKGATISVHYEHMAGFAELFPAVPLSSDIFNIGEECISCCGGMASTDLALEIVRRQHGIGLANASAKYIIHGRLRSSKEVQKMAASEPAGHAPPRRLKMAVELMASRLEEPISLAQLAGMIRISQRSLERLFRRCTGQSPQSYYMNLRLERARSLITQTSLSVLEISVACGFVAPSHFSRAYKKRYRVRPTEDRSLGRIPFQFRDSPTLATMSHEADMPKAQR